MLKEFGHNTMDGTRILRFLPKAALFSTYEMMSLAYLDQALALFSATSIPESHLMRMLSSSSGESVDTAK